MPLIEIESDSAIAIPVPEIEAQLARVLGSHHFRHSQRYPALLRFLVEQACRVPGQHIKERLIGIEVFHRAPDYDTNIDPVVRVTAAEVRKRIAQYYGEPEHSGELRIDLPIGTYMPRFVRPQPAPPPLHRSVPEGAIEMPAEAAEDGKEQDEQEGTPAPSTESEAHTVPGRARRWSQRLRTAMLACIAGVVGVVLALGGVWAYQAVVSHREHAVLGLWEPIASAGAPVLLVVGSHTVGAPGNALRAEQGAPASPSESVLRMMNEYEQIPLNDVNSLLRLHAFLTQQRKEYRVLGAGAADIQELRDGPVVLFGGFDNRWTMRLSQQLRFRFLDSPDDANGTIDDTQTPDRRWQVNFTQSYSNLRMDYAVVARYFDPMIEQPVLLVAGIGAAGTGAASEFVTSERMLEEVNRLRPRTGTRDNMELVLAVQVVDGKAGPPHVVASQFW